MNGFKVQVPNLYTAMDTEQQLEGVLQQAANGVMSVKRNLRVQIRQRERIDNQLETIVRQIEAQGRSVKRVAGVGRQAAEEYQRTEEILLGLKPTPRTEPQKKPKGVFDLLEEHFTSFYGEEGEKGTCWDRINGLLTFMDKYLDDDDASLSKDILSYIKSVKDFFWGDLKGKNGIVNYCELGDKSAGVWSALYSYLKGSSATEESMGKFAKQWGETNGIVSILGDGLGFLAAYISAFDFKNKSAAENIAGFIDTGGDGAKLVKSVYNLEHLGETLAKKGPYTAAGLYATLADTICSTFSRTIKSVEKYSEDGSFDFGDWGATMIDASTEGLCSILSGLTFGIPEKVFGLDAEKISKSLNDWAAGVGKAIGNFILDITGKGHASGRTSRGSSRTF